MIRGLRTGSYVGSGKGIYKVYAMSVSQVLALQGYKECEDSEENVFSADNTIINPINNDTAHCVYLLLGAGFFLIIKYLKMETLNQKLTTLIKIVESTEHKVGLETLKEVKSQVETLIDLLKSDSVYTALRLAYKSPSRSGMDDCDDSSYIDLYEIIKELR